MAGCEAIIEKIIADATKTSKVILSEAKAQYDETVKNAEEYSTQYSERQLVDIENEARLTIERKNTVAVLDSKKISLKAKQELIDKAFELAKENVLNLPKDKYLDFIGKLITEYADKNDEVVVSQKEKYIDGEFLKKFEKVTLSTDKGDFEGGIILRSKACDKNLTLSTILRSLREEIEQEVASQLF